MNRYSSDTPVQGCPQFTLWRYTTLPGDLTICVISKRRGLYAAARRLTAGLRSCARAMGADGLCRCRLLHVDLVLAIRRGAHKAAAAAAASDRTGCGG